MQIMPRLPLFSVSDKRLSVTEGTGGGGEKQKIETNI